MSTITHDEAMKALNTGHALKVADYIAQQRARDGANCQPKTTPEKLTDTVTLPREVVGFLEKIAKQRTVAEWEKFAEGEGLDPDGGDYTGAYDAIVREARTALAALDAATAGAERTTP